MLQLIGGLQIARALYAVADLGIADGLAGGPMTTARLARATGTHEPTLFRVLRLLASVGVLREQPARTFGLTVLGDRLRTGVPASVRSWAMLADTIGLDSFWPIIEMVRTGRPGVEISYGMKTFEHLHRDPERAARFDAAMSERTAAYAPSVADRYDFADSDGGRPRRRPRHLLAAILRRTRACTASCSSSPRGGSARCGPRGGRVGGLRRDRGWGFLPGRAGGPTATCWPTSSTTGTTPSPSTSWPAAARPCPRRPDAA